MGAGGASSAIGVVSVFFSTRATTGATNTSARSRRHDQTSGLIGRPAQLLLTMQGNAVARSWVVSGGMCGQGLQLLGIGVGGRRPCRERPAARPCAAATGTALATCRPPKMPCVAAAPPSAPAPDRRPQPRRQSAAAHGCDRPRPAFGARPLLAARSCQKRSPGRASRLDASRMEPRAPRAGAYGLGLKRECAALQHAAACSNTISGTMGSQVELQATRQRRHGHLLRIGGGQNKFQVFGQLSSVFNMALKAVLVGACAPRRS